MRPDRGGGRDQPGGRAGSVRAFIALVASSHIGFDPHSTTYTEVLPVNRQGLIKYDTGVFYPFLPDVSIARLMFLGGLAAAALGALGLPTGSGGRPLRRIGARDPSRE